MAVNVVTGQGGTNHISSDNARYANAATFGKGKYVLNIGNKFSATVESPNLVRIMDGMAINQGTQIGIDPDDYEDVGIENGVTGMNRNDIIVMRYIRNDSTSIESGVMEVISGESVSGTPTDPAITSGNILDGKELVDDFPLYRVKVRGLTIEGLDTLFTVWNKDLETYSGDMTSALATKVDKSAVQSAVNTSTNPVSSNAVRTALASKADTASVRLLNGATAIPANANLDSYTTPGNYGASSSATARTISNVPEQTAFGLRVYYATPTSDLSQEFETLAEHHFYHRTYSSGSWRAWEKQPTRAEITSINNEIDEIIAGQVHGVLAESVNDVLGAKNLLSIKELELMTGKNISDDGNGNYSFTHSSSGMNVGYFVFSENDIEVTLSMESLITQPSGQNARLVLKNKNGDTVGGLVGLGTLTATGLANKVKYEYGSATIGTTTFHKPMLRPAAYESATFAPYAKSNRELTLDVAVLPENAQKNLLDFDAFAEHANSIVPGAVVNVGSNEYTVEMGSIRQVTEPTAGGTPFRFSNTDIDVTFTITASKGTGNNLIICLFDTSNEYVASVGATNIQNEQMTVRGRACSIVFSFGSGGTYTIKNPMIRPSGTSPDFVPYMHSNLELSHMYEGNETYNLLEITASSQTINGVTFTVDKDAGTVTANGTASGNAYFPLRSSRASIVPNGLYIVSGSIGGSAGKYGLYIYGDTSTGQGNVLQYDSSVEITGSELISIMISSGQTVTNKVFKPMLRKSTAPSEFVPYRKTNGRLTAEVAKLTAEIANQCVLAGGTGLTGNADLDDYKTPGNYYCSASKAASTVRNIPEKTAFTLKVFYATGVAYPRQEFRAYNSGNIYDRWFNLDSGYQSWSSWVKRPTRSELDAKLSQSDVQTQLLANNKPIASNVVYNLVEADNTSARRMYIGILMDVYVLIPIGITTYRRNENNSLIRCTDAYATSGSVSFTGQVYKYQNAFLVDLPNTYSQSTTPKMGSLVYVTLTGVM